ncbi:ABC transporter substrate-binding protein [Halobellus rarus]|uniref:ABC transporter substrate-binding protein n=1 Tax=Halobellus rarus TaxID=1126237 RepID=A0ABD6CRA6_9EURY
MDDDNTTRYEAPTRRDCIKYGGGIIGSGLLAGCSGGDSGSTTPGTTTADETEPGTSPPTEQSYSVTMAPMGEVSFDAVPEDVYTGLPNTADMAIAAGRSDAINAVYYPEYHGTLMNRFYERLDGVSFEWESLTDSWGLGKEGFYELDSDVHLTDPAYASTLDALDQADVEEIREQIAPWFGNYYSNTRSDPPTEWATNYEYYSLWEMFEKVGQVFQAGDRARRLAEVHSELVASIEADLPPESDRPSATLVFPGQDETFWIYHLNGPGFLSAHTRPLGAPDAFGDAEWSGPSQQVDYEAMVERDPDVLLVLFTMSTDYNIQDIRDTLEDSPVAQQVSAVENNRVHAQGVRYQGPILNLFQLEMTAKQLYPDAFGEWPTYVDGPYPEIPEDEQLFDRQRVANIINGEFEA